MNQNDRLEFLVKKFREDSGQYKDIEIPDGEVEKKNLLRSHHSEIKVINIFGSKLF